MAKRCDNINIVIIIFHEILDDAIAIFTYSYFMKIHPALPISLHYTTCTSYHIVIAELPGDEFLLS